MGVKEISSKSEERKDEVIPLDYLCHIISLSEETLSFPPWSDSQALSTSFCWIISLSLSLAAEEEKGTRGFILFRGLFIWKLSPGWRRVSCWWTLFVGVIFSWYGTSADRGLNEISYKQWNEMTWKRCSLSSRNTGCVITLRDEDWEGKLLIHWYPLLGWIESYQYIKSSWFIETERRCRLTWSLRAEGKTKIRS